MKKVLIAFDGTNSPSGAFEFARQMHRVSPILLVGIFLPQVNLASVWSYANAMSGPAMIPLIEEEQAVQIQKNIKGFEKKCKDHHIACRVHKDYFGLSVAELPKETRFADLVLVGGEKSESTLVESEHMNYIKDLLKNTECPVVVVPEDFKQTGFNILAYDGSSSSVFAIKQFTYLFPELCNRGTLLVYLRTDHSNPMPKKDYITEYATQQFPDLTIQCLEVRRHKFLTEWLDGKPDAMLVCGACGRSFVSEMVKQSFVSEVIQARKHPLFIAHR